MRKGKTRRRAFRRISPSGSRGQFTPDRVAGLDRLLLLREPGGVTWLEWLRTPAADGSARPIVGQIEKLRELQALEADLVDLSMLPPGRVRILASEARRRSAWELSRLPPARRYPVLLVFIATGRAPLGESTDLLDSHNNGYRA